MAAFLAVEPALEEDALLPVLLRCAMHVTDAGGAGLTLFDADRRRLVFRAAVGDGSENILGYEVPLEGSIHGLAFATGEIQAATPLHTQVATTVGVAFRSVLVAPLIVNGEPIGTMSAVNKRSAEQFTSRDMEAYKWFSDLAAIVVRQHLRHRVLLRAIEGGRADAPEGLSGLVLLDQDRRLLQIVSQIARHARGSDKSMSLLEHFLPMLPVN
jgi:GAF domain-containing protein